VSYITRDLNPFAFSRITGTEIKINYSQKLLRLDGTFDLQKFSEIKKAAIVRMSPATIERLNLTNISTTQNVDCIIAGKLERIPDSVEVSTILFSVVDYSFNENVTVLHLMERLKNTEATL